MDTTSQPAGPQQFGRWSALALVSAMLVGAVLLFSAVTKMISAPAFISTIQDFEMLPGFLVLPGATLLIGLEFGLALMLILGPGRRTAAWITAPLAAVFMVFNTIAIQKGLTDCGCFGEVIKVAPQQELILNGVMLVLAVLVIRFAAPFRSPHALVAPTLGWGGLALGAALFLMGGPVVASDGEGLDVTMDDLAVLSQATPPVELADDAFLFFFSADCDHCWAFAGGVQAMHDRIEGLQVIGVTNSDPMSLDAFEEAFRPTYPIHRLDPKVFDQLVSMYPAAVFVQAGGVADTWSGFVPSHRQIAEGYGYFYREDPPAPADDVVDEVDDVDSDTSGLFGGTVSGRRQ